MNFKAKTEKILPSLAELLVQPKEFWMDKAKNGFQDNVFLHLFVPLTLITSLAAFVGNFLNSEMFVFSYAVGVSVRELLSSFITVFLSGFLISKIAKNFKSKVDLDTIYRVLAYAMVPVFITSTIVYLFNFLWPLSALGLYSFYQYYLGVRTCFKVPAYNLSKFTSLSVLTLIFVAGSTNALSWFIFKTLFSHGI